MYVLVTGYNVVKLKLHFCSELQVKNMLVQYSLCIATVHAKIDYDWSRNATQIYNQLQYDIYAEILPIE